ncbi:hypothetical protein D3C79_981330 [compost metagenome]
MQPLAYDVLQPDIAIMPALLRLHRQILLNRPHQLPAQLNLTQIVFMQIGQMHSHSTADVTAHDGRRHIT